MDYTALLIAASGIALGGFLKGATGAGAPVVGVPILALVVGVPGAVAIFSMLNLISNIWQSWAYRGDVASPRFVRVFAISGAFGAAAGSVMLARLPTEALMGSLAGVVLLYIAVRLARPGWTLARDRGAQVAPAVGFVGGVMQGAGGISAPVSITFLNAMRLERREFIGTISVYFLSMSVLQVPTLAALGIMTWERAGFGLLAALPLFGAMPLGEMAARRVSREVFDKLILILLAVIAAKLFWSALA